MLPNGPVGQNGSLASGDELLEVNGRKLLGLYHADVVTILKVTLSRYELKQGYILYIMQNSKLVGNWRGDDRNAQYISPI